MPTYASSLGFKMPPSPKALSTHDVFYRATCVVGRFAMFATSHHPMVIDAHHAKRQGGYILASNHFSHFDVPILMRSTPRRLDFVSIVEAFKTPWVAWFFSHMNAFPLDRHHADPQTVRVILDRLEQGRVIAMFPEAGLRSEANSIVNGGKFRPGVARIAKLANVPIIPAVVDGGVAYNNPINHLPLRRVRYGIIYGEPIEPADEAETTEKLRAVYPALYKRLREAMSAQP